MMFDEADQIPRCGEFGKRREIVRILALIPARKGSKRVTDKNKKILLDRSLIEWTIDVAKSVDQISSVLVSTDDPEIVDIAMKCGVLAPWLRPDHLSKDDSSSAEVALHAVDWFESNFEQIDGLLLLQPTSPFRTKETLIRGIELFESSNFDPIIGVAKIKQHPSWAYKVKNDHLEKFIEDKKMPSRSQDLEEVYFPTGSFYLVSPAELRSRKSVSPLPSLPLIIDGFEESIDIDTEDDFRIAEIVASSVKEIHPRHGLS
jgi:CMP-N,N'-diacetyllegionaminic acid synthase